MNPERLSTLPDRLVALDTETYKIEWGSKTPRFVCGSASWLTRSLAQGPVIEGALLSKDNTREIFAQVLEDPDAVLGGANLAFDLAVLAEDFAKLGIDVMPNIFEMFDPDRDGLARRGRVFDLQVAEALGAIAEGYLGRDPQTGGPLKNPETGKPGSYSLSMCVSLTLGRQDAKVNDAWRLRYGELDPHPIDAWPVEARDYPVDDARNTLEVCLAQAGHLPKVAAQHDWENITYPDGRKALVCKDCKTSRISAMCMARRPHKNLHELSKQVYSAFCLHLGDAHGMRVDQSRVTVVENYFTRKRERGITKFIEAGIIREDGSENQAKIKRLVALAYGAVEDCADCAGKGELPHPDQPTLRCPDCRGRCQPWKAGGKIKPPEVDNCVRCNNTARVLHHNVKMTKCASCDGTGLDISGLDNKTDGGGVAISRDALTESGDEFLMSLGDFKDDQKVLNVYVPYLRTARLCTLCAQPATKKYPHLDTCPTNIGMPHGWREIWLLLSSNAVLETGRVSYRGLIQLFPRAPGFIDPETGEYIYSLRECFVARAEVWEEVEVPDDYVLQPGEVLVGGAS